MFDTSGPRAGSWPWRHALVARGCTGAGPIANRRGMPCSAPRKRTPNPSQPAPRGISVARRADGSIQ
jgi:hypothetical protein